MSHWAVIEDVITKAVQETLESEISLLAEAGAMETLKGMWDDVGERFGNRVAAYTDWYGGFIEQQTTKEERAIRRFVERESEREASFALLDRAISLAREEDLFP